MNRLSSLFLLCLLSFTYGQDRYIAQLGSDSIPYLHRSTLKDRLPNRPLQLIVVDSPGLEAEISGYWRAIDPQHVREEWHQVVVYLPAKERRRPRQLKAFVDYIFSTWFFDRNRIHVIFDSREMAEVFGESNWITSKWVPGDGLLKEGHYIWSETDFIERTQTLRHGTDFEAVRLGDMKKYTERRDRIRDYYSIGKTHIISVTGGYYQVGSNNAVAIDEENLIDLREVTSLWNINYTYMRNERVGLVAQIGFSMASDATTETIRTTYGTFISGEGSGAAITKLGIGVRYVPFKTRRWHFYSEFVLGSLSARVVEGQGAGSLSGGASFVESEENRGTSFADFRLGSQYRLGQNWYLSGNLQLTRSRFKEDFGSVSGLSGSGINLGIGFTF